MGTLSAYAKSYTIPVAELEALRHLGMSFTAARSAPDGVLSSWVERQRFARDGEHWITLQERGQGWAVAFALDANDDVVGVRALSPAEARALDR